MVVCTLVRIRGRQGGRREATPAWGRCGAPEEHAERNMTGSTLKTQTAEASNVSEEST